MIPTSYSNSNETNSSTCEVVSHPSYYNKGIECIEVMKNVFGKEVVKNFCLLNAFKYLYRCNSKHDTPTTDISKAKWYLDYILEHLSV